MYTEVNFQQFYVDTQCETGAAVVNREDVASPDLRLPGGATIKFGAVTTEAWTHANATRCILSLKKKTVEAGSGSSLGTLTFPKASTDTVNPGCAAVGSRLESSGAFTILPGEIVYLEVTTAAGAAGGAFRGYIIGRMDGVSGANAAAPVVQSSS